jgi:hypothetical protein
MLSNYLAEVWGISIVVVCLALLVKDGHLKKFYASLETEDNFFLWGFISFVIGIAMILVYNVWAWNWQVIITLLGWAALVKGLFLLFLPETMKAWVKKINYQKWMPVWLVVLLIIGLVITYLGFTA